MHVNAFPTLYIFEAYCNQNEWTSKIGRWLPSATLLSEVLFVSSIAAYKWAYNVDNPATYS